MKKLIIMALFFVFTLSLVGCGKIYELPHDQFCYSLDGTKNIDIDYSDKKYIINILNNGNWVNDLGNCDCDYVFYTQKQEVRYHSECGSFNDYTTKKTMTVTEEQRQIINGILNK